MEDERENLNSKLHGISYRPYIKNESFFDFTFYAKFPVLIKFNKEFDEGKAFNILFLMISFEKIGSFFDDSSKS
jgi:hypothetical protein